jgi:glycosyltransferase involved in cell wall biosynthesis
LRILHLLNQRPDSTGSGIYVQAMIREAAACGHQNHLVAGIPSDGSGELDCIDSDQCCFVRFGGTGISYRIVGMSDVMPYPSTRWCDLTHAHLDEYQASFSKTLRAAVAAFQPDLIHSHHLWVVSSLARQLFPDIPMVTTCHGTDLRQFQNCPHLQKRVLAGCRGIDAVMALGQTQKNDIVELYGLLPEKVFVVGAGYNDRLFNEGRKPPPEPVQLIYAGKLSNAKGVPWMLRALAAVDAPVWRLHLVGGGSGAEKEECLRLASLLGERVVVHGAVPQTDLAREMKQSHLFVLPSFYEGLPLVVLEALASGCRIVVTDLPGVNEILGDVQADFIRLVPAPRLRFLDQPFPEDALRFERDLAAALQTQIRKAADRPQIDLSPIRKKMTRFSWPGIFQKVQAVYFQVVNR